MAKKEFKTESKRILDLMINSIYTHKEIFLREIISNASDAIDKLCYISLTDDSVGMNRDDFKITVSVDKDARRITVSDNGIGMTEEELESNLGVIARSGSLKFKSELDGENSGDTDIIGQFGVGFYSAFMVSSKVAVITRAYNEDTAHCWVSDGADGYTISECEKEKPGTDIVMEIKEDAAECKYSAFLEDSKLRDIIKKYSDYIRWPIVMGDETVNSQIPIWQRSKTDVSDDECKKFYKDKFYDETDPVSVIRINAEGSVSYKAMLFIPEKAPYDYYTKSYEPGLELYASGVLIMDKCSDLLPECFRFVRGIVDSPDLSLNISRELLQHDRQLNVIANNIEKKIRAELIKLMENDREKYEEFFKNFGLQLKYGTVANYGARRGTLADLMLFRSEKTGKFVSLNEYAAAMPEEQKYIYYACAESAAIASALPQSEPIREKGYDILILTDHVDDFLMTVLASHDDKDFKSVNDPDLGLESDEEKQESEKTAEENRELLDFVVEALEGKIAAASVSKKLIKSPVCLAAQGPISLEMERSFASMPAVDGKQIKAERVLEINCGHSVFEALKNAYETDKEKAKRYAKILYAQAELSYGLMPDDPAEFSELVCELMK